METNNTATKAVIKKWFSICKDPDGELFIIGYGMKPQLFDSKKGSVKSTFPCRGCF